MARRTSLTPREPSMFENTKAYSGFSVSDVEDARRFYGETLGIKTSEEYGLLWLHLAGGVQFDRNEHTDEKGIMREEGPYIAWFTDPAGNVLSVLQER